MVSTASTVRNPGQARSASRLAASGQANPRRRTSRPWLSSKASKTGPVGETVLLTTLLYRQKRLALIGLEDQQIIRVPVQDPASDRLLAAHGIQSHNAVLQGERLEQRWDRGDLVRLAIDLTLAEHQALLAGPGADQVQRPLRPAAVKGAAQGLAVNGHDLPVEDLGKGLSP